MLSDEHEKAREKLARDGKKGREKCSQAAGEHTCASLPSILNQSFSEMSLTSKGWCEVQTLCFMQKTSGCSGLNVTYWLPRALTGLVGIDGMSAGRRFPQQLSTAPILLPLPLAAAV